MRHNEGKKGRSFSGKKALPVFLICLAVLLALLLPLLLAVPALALDSYELFAR